MPTRWPRRAIFWSVLRRPVIVVFVIGWPVIVIIVGWRGRYHIGWG